MATQAQIDRQAEAYRLYEEGLRGDALGKALGVSYVRAWQLVQKGRKLATGSELTERQKKRRGV